MAKPVADLVADDGLGRSRGLLRGEACELELQPDMQLDLKMDAPLPPLPVDNLAGLALVLASTFIG